jgi:hypothetical protein
MQMQRNHNMQPLQTYTPGMPEAVRRERPLTAQRLKSKLPLQSETYSIRRHLQEKEMEK